MDAKALLERMTDKAAKVPLVRDVTAAYAARLASIAHKLSQEELEGMVQMGVVINDRTTVLVPVLRADQIDTWLAAEGVVPRPVGT